MTEDIIAPILKEQGIPLAAIWLVVETLGRLTSSARIELADALIREEVEAAAIIPLYDASALDGLTYTVR